MVIILQRKILAAILSCLLYALITVFIWGFSKNLFLNTYFINFIFVITYGIMTSFISDWLSRRISKKMYVREISSFAFHCFFGMIFIFLSLGPAIVFFIVDRLLIKAKIGWLSVIIALLIVVLLFIISIT